MLNRLYGWYGKGVVRTVLVLMVALIVAALFMRSFGESRSENGSVSAALTPVTVATIGELANSGSFSVVGTVSAISEARLLTEAGGRITSVSVGIGDRVSAGQVIATIENSRERAALLQAEGAYESALASSEGSTVGLDEARANIMDLYRNSFTAVDGIVRNLIDDFFLNPDTALRGFRLDGQGRTFEINAARGDIETMLDTWNDEVRGDLATLAPETMLARAEERVTVVQDLLITLAFVVAEEDPNTVFTRTVLDGYASDIEGARGTLNGTLSAITNARAGLERAKIAGEPDARSQSSALVKSALGTLRAAEAAYEKTIVRSPIAGTVNALYLKAGEFTQPGQPAAVVANNGSLEVKTALSEADIVGVSAGDSVRIDQDIEGTVTRVAPAIDPLSGKSEVRIGISEDERDLKNGSTVTVTFSRTSANEDESLLVPLAALKFLPQGPVAFTVSEASTLIAHPVTIGAVRGTAVEVEEGLTHEMRIVTDARGLTEGDAVEVSVD
jgi:multidrug efflux pump subunit AcrA (membrane-fusion protein)